MAQQMNEWDKYLIRNELVNKKLNDSQENTQKYNDGEINMNEWLKNKSINESANIS